MGTRWNQQAGATSIQQVAFNKRLETVGWASLLIVTGAIWMAPKGLVPDGVWLLGFGLILAGVNVARRWNGVPVSGFGLALGVLAIALGACELAGSMLGLAVGLPVFAIWLTVLGAIILVRELGANANR